MKRAVLALLVVLPFAAPAANLRLYTVDGEYQVVREYQINGDRVRFYSIDRSEWEEIPASLVDLKKTQAEIAAKKDTQDRLDKQDADEATAARAERAELARIPGDSGVYRIENGVIRTFPAADFTVPTANGRTALQILTPIPIIPGKATVQIKGEKSPNVVNDDRPEFYFRLDKQESFGIIRIKPGKGIRIAETIEIEPLIKETEETRDSVEIFSKQLSGENFYKIWPREPLPKGEYAVIEYVEDKVDLRLWDFRIE